MKLQTKHVAVILQISEVLDRKAYLAHEYTHVPFTGSELIHRALYRLLSISATQGLFADESVLEAFLETFLEEAKELPERPS